MAVDALISIRQFGQLALAELDFMEHFGMHRMTKIAALASVLGFKRFVFHFGIQCFGLSVFVFMCLFNVVINHNINEVEFLLRLAASLVSGIFWGVLMWRHAKKN